MNGPEICSLLKFGTGILSDKGDLLHEIIILLHPIVVNVARTIKRCKIFKVQ